MEYISLEKAKKILGTDSDPDARDIIVEAKMLFEASLGRSLEKQSYTRYIDGNGSNFLYLEVVPVSVESVEVDGRRVEVRDIDGLTVILAGSVEKGRKNVKITYTAGFDGCPDDVKIFFEKFLADMVDTEKNASLIGSGIKSQKIGDLSVTYLSPEEFHSLGAGSRVSSPAMQEIFNKYKAFSLHATL